LTGLCHSGYNADMNTDKKDLPLWQRVIIGIGLPALALTVCILVYNGARSRCVFYELTGLYCPGCGSGRALLHIFAGDFSAAFKSNVMFFLMGFPAGLTIVYEYLRLVFPRLRLKPLHIPQWAVYFCTVLLCTYWVLRNIPLFAFLAP